MDIFIWMNIWYYTNTHNIPIYFSNIYIYIVSWKIQSLISNHIRGLLNEDFVSLLFLVFEYVSYFFNITNCFSYLLSQKKEIWNTQNPSHKSRICCHHFCLPLLWMSFDISWYVNRLYFVCKESFLFLNKLFNIWKASFAIWYIYCNFEVLGNQCCSIAITW